MIYKIYKLHKIHFPLPVVNVNVQSHNQLSMSGKVSCHCQFSAGICQFSLSIIGDSCQL